MSTYPIHRNSVPAIDGVLSQWVAQPQSNPTETLNDLQFTEVFKGPYYLGRIILNTIKVGDTLEEAHNAIAGETPSGSLNQLFNPPPNPQRNGVTYRWEVKGIECKQIDPAGDHCFLTIRYQGVDTSVDVETLTEDPYQDVWSISWQSYTVSPWAFCGNPTDGQNRNMPVGQADAEDPRWTASRTTIETNMSQNAQLDTFKRIYEPGAQDYLLNNAEKLVKQKVQNNVNAIYHYPVIIHQTVKRGQYSSSASYDETLGEDLDIISGNLPKNCPYEFPNEDPSWKWMKIGDDITQTHTKQTTTFTRREIWRGMKTADINYYGSVPFDHSSKEALLSCRWEIGQV